MAMQGDSGSRLPLPPAPDIWTLPEIESIEIARVRYVPPRVQVMKGRLIEIEEGVEIVVRTSGEIPVRALAPALRVGTAEVAESERFGPCAYRFFVLEEVELVPGAPLSLGWSGIPPREVSTRYCYRPPSDVPITRHWRDRARPQRWGIMGFLIKLIRRMLKRLSGSPLPR
jgi:hypothetical protein